MYFAVAADGLDGGAQITASHNPEAVQRLQAGAEGSVSAQRRVGHQGNEGDDPRRHAPAARAAPGSRRARRDARPLRRARACRSSTSRSSSRSTSCSTPAAASAGFVAPRLFDRLPCRPRGCASRWTARFPNHEANPLIEENRRDITERVIAERADIGIAWDGDADRCFFLDGTGEFIAGDFVTALLAEAFLMKHPGSTIIYDVRASYAVKDIVAKYGGTALMNRVGHAFIKRRMREEDAIFGGEVTGHYYFRDNFYADNGFIPALLILELMSKKGQSLRDLLRAAAREVLHLGRDQHQGGEHGGGGREDRDASRAIRARQRLPLDGISVEFDDWHFNVRPSNTEPLLRLNLEGLTPEIMEKRRDEVLGISWSQQLKRRLRLALCADPRATVGKPSCILEAKVGAGDGDRTRDQQLGKL